jgi:hypothetical protein
MPLGIPAVFLSDLLDPNLPGVPNPEAQETLCAEYVGAHGFAFNWGQIVMQQMLSATVWRIVPVRLWEEERLERPSLPARIPDLLPLLAPCVRTVVGPQLPRGLALASLQCDGRRSRYALLSFVLVDASCHERVRRWLGRRFVPELLPVILHEAGVRLREMVGPIGPLPASEAVAVRHHDLGHVGAFP